MDSSLLPGFMNVPIVLIFAAVGFFVSWYIFYKKHKKKQKLVCIVGKDCDKVVHSRYSKIFGIHLEVLGMLYYGFVIVVAGALLLGIRIMLGFSLAQILFAVSGLAAIVSLVLVYIQGAVIREWCEYCLVSATASILIFITEIIGIL